MKYVKTYEFFGNRNYYSIDDLFEDIDPTKIKIKIFDYSKLYSSKIIDYEKCGNIYMTRQRKHRSL
jgi:hypothetical protein